MLTKQPVKDLSDSIFVQCFHKVNHDYPNLFENTKCEILISDFLKQIRDEIIESTLTSEHKYINIVFNKYLNEK